MDEATTIMENIAKLIPLGTDSASLIGSLRGKLKITGNIMSGGRSCRGIPSPTLHRSQP